MRTLRRRSGSVEPFTQSVFSRNGPTVGFSRPLFLLSTVLLLVLSISSCAPRAIPSVQFNEFGFPAGPQQTERKSDIDITLSTVHIADIYQHPDLFGFDQSRLLQPGDKEGAAVVAFTYPRGPLNKQWEYPFITPDQTERIVLCKAKIKNGTGHILRMRDARVYMVPEGREPIPALASFDELLKRADYFEQAQNRDLSQKGRKPLPTGLYRSIVLDNQKAYKLINDVGKEILPGYTYDGVLAFYVDMDAVYSSAKVSFFDITTKTDAAGNPVEKAQFDFPMELQKVTMWYDNEAKMWKKGSPPVQE